MYTSYEHAVQYNALIFVYRGQQIKNKTSKKNQIKEMQQNNYIYYQIMITYTCMGYLNEC